MPHPDRWERVRTLLEALIDRPVNDRPKFLASACANEPDIRREVESLLNAHDAAAGFLEPERRPLSRTGTPIEADSPGLQPGTRLGAFEVVAPLGSGGMGQVYRARDTRLDRNVALKVLAPDLARSASSRERFEREAQAISRLTHPHICVLYDVGSISLPGEGERQFLVMELVQGETLGARLSRGPLPIDQAVRLAIQIADALAAAHTHGIVHRDLKPANIMLTKSGVKLLDFGLALFQPGSAGQRRDASGPSTDIGLLAGTLPYISPEQLEGREPDTRADMFSFGAVLFEIVTGRRMFGGTTDASVIPAILSTPPPAGQIKPPTLDYVIRTCVARDPEDRWATMHDVRLQLQWIGEQGLSAVGEPSPVTGNRPRWQRAISWAVAAALAVLAGMGISDWRRSEIAVRNPTHRLSVDLGATGTLPLTDVPIALSADGAWLAFVARTGKDAPLLHVRRLDQLTATPLGGTAGASTPCFSPDAQWVAFFADGKLKKVPVTGGAVLPLADAPEPRGMWWAEDDRIVFAPHYRAGLMRVSSFGGSTEQLTTLRDGEISHRFPQVLPGGGAVLYTASTEVNIGLGSTVMIQPLPSGQPRLVQGGAYFGRYVRSGHILYVQNDGLHAVPFDARRLQVTGPAGLTLDAVESDSTRGSAQLTVASVGTMVYVRGTNRFGPRPMAWLDRAGTLASLRTIPADWSNAAFSPDGTRVAMDLRSGNDTNIHVYDLERNTLTPVTSEPTNEDFPVWTADGSRLVYRSFRSATDPSGYAIMWKHADGSGDAQVLVRSEIPLRPGSWHPTRNILAYAATASVNNDDLMILPVEGDEAGGWRAGTPTPYIRTSARERAPQFSPDGKWLAYASNESGRDEIYVRPFPGPGERVTVSSEGGENPTWSPARSELVFAAPAGDYLRVLMVASYSLSNAGFRVTKTHPWSERAIRVRVLLGDRVYALHPDGKRAAIAPLAEQETSARTRLTVVSNLFEQLGAIAPAAR